MKADADRKSSNLHKQTKSEAECKIKHSLLFTITPKSPITYTDVVGLFGVYDKL